MHCKHGNFAAKQVGISDLSLILHVVISKHNILLLDFAYCLAYEMITWPGITTLCAGWSQSGKAAKISFTCLLVLLQDDIEALLRRLEQTPEHERRRDAPAVRTEFAGLQRRFADLEGNLERLQQAKQQQG